MNEDSFMGSFFASSKMIVFKEKNHPSALQFAAAVQVSIKTPMAKDQKTSSSPLPATNSDTQTKIYSVLPLFGFINVTITSGITIYRAHSNGDIPMVIFITFVYFGTLLLDYWFRLYHSLPRHEKSARKHKLKIGIWILLSSIMFGFACEFSTFMRPFESLAFFGLVLCGNSLLFYVYFIWNGGEHKTCECEICLKSNSEGKNRVTHSSGKGEEEENKALIENSDCV